MSAPLRLCLESRWLKSLLVTCLLLAGLLGCRPSVDTLKIVGIRGLQTRSVDASGTVIDLRVAVENPSASAVRVTGMDLQMGLSGSYIATGSCLNPADLPGHGVGEFEVRLVVTWAKVTRADFEAILLSEVPYKLEGTVSIDKPIRMAKVRVQAQGVYRVPGPLRVSVRPSGEALGLVSLNGIKVNGLGLGRQDGVLEVTLENPVGFEVPVSRLDYQIEGGGVMVAKGSLKHLRIQAGKNRVQVPFTMSALALGRGAIGSLLRGSLPGLHARGVIVLGEPGQERMLEWESETE